MSSKGYGENLSNDSGYTIIVMRALAARRVTGRDPKFILYNHPRCEMRDTNARCAQL